MEKGELGVNYTERGKRIGGFGSSLSPFTTSYLVECALSAVNWTCWVVKFGKGGIRGKLYTKGEIFRGVW